VRLVGRRKLLGPLILGVLLTGTGIRFLLEGLGYEELVLRVHMFFLDRLEVRRNLLLGLFFRVGLVLFLGLRLAVEHSLLARLLH